MSYLLCLSPPPRRAGRLLIGAGDMWGEGLDSPAPSEERSSFYVSFHHCPNTLVAQLLPICLKPQKQSSLDSQTITAILESKHPLCPTATHTVALSSRLCIWFNFFFIYVFVSV